MQALASGLRTKLLALAAAALMSWSAPAQAQRGDSIPSQMYYGGLSQLYSGDFRDAQRTFTRSLTSGVKTIYQGGTVRWIDSICYYTMLGETYYQWGQPALALEQFNYAATLFLQYPRWMLRVQFDVQPVADTTLGRIAAPWGGSTRPSVPGKFPGTYNVAQGTLDNQRAVQQGGVVQQAQLWPVNVVEIVRATSLMIRRRNELLGPLGPHDAISKQLAVALARGGAPPNHWSSAWVDIERGLAQAGVGDMQAAAQSLESGTLIAGRFDHPLTGIALLEQGRLALLNGNTEAAGRLMAEASYSAYIFQDPTVIDDAFRWGELARIGAGAPGLNPALPLAAAWARRERFDYLGARLSLLLAEELITLGNVKDASVALAAGVAQLKDARTGVLGNWASYLDAKLQYAQQRPSAYAALTGAVAGQMKISLPNFQINLANTMYDSQTLPTRSAPSVYEALLADPGTADTVLRPLEVMAVMKTQHDAAFDRWIDAALDRKNLAGALDISDRAKRRRFHNAQPWGGRLAAIRDIMAAPVETLTPTQRQQQSDLVTRYPELADVVGQATRLRTELQASWKPEAPKEEQEQATRQWAEYLDAINDREMQLGQVGLARVPAELSFPPILGAADLQKRLKPGQAAVVFHETSSGMLAFLITREAAKGWQCGPANRMGGLVAQFLRDLGNYDASRELTAEELQSEEWKKSGGKLFEALLADTPLGSSGLKELVIVPDGLVWYVPFEALTVKIGDKATPLVELASIRYAPTVGLAFSFDGAWRRVQRTGLVVGAIVPGDKPEERLAAAAGLQAALPGATPLAAPLPAPSPAIASVLDALVVLEDIDAESADPLAWSPMPIDKSAANGALDQWLLLPGAGPQRIVLAGMHTLAERGGKASRRKGVAAAPGDELFYASTSLMAAGAETMLLTRWRVGGQSTLDLVREFVQELPHTAAPDAWKRSIELGMEMPIDPASELRVKAGKTAVDLTAKHPFFWAGYLVVDSGWAPEDEAAAAEPGAAPAEAPAAPGAAPPVAGAPSPGAPPVAVAIPPGLEAPAGVGEAMPEKPEGPPADGAAPPDGEEAKRSDVPPPPRPPARRPAK